jgi:hypothetical protein
MAMYEGSPLRPGRQHAVTLTMPDAGMSENQSRCPTCNDSFSVPAGDSHRPVQCPSCRQKAAGATLLDADVLDADLPDVVPTESPADDARTILMLTPPHPDAAGAAPEEAANAAGIDTRSAGSNETAARAVSEDPSDEGRTHLMLRNPRAAPASEAAAEDEQKTRLMGRIDWQALGVQTPGGAPTHARPRANSVADDARTHLLLNADDLKDEEDAEVPVAPAPLPASDPWTSNAHAVNLEGPKPQDPDEARTHLLLDAEDLKELPPPALERLPEKLGRLTPHLLRFGRRVDQLLGERWTLALAGLALAAGVVAPLGAALSARTGAALHTLVAMAALIGGAAYGCAWCGRVAAEDGEWGPGLPGARFRSAVRLLLEDLGEFGRSPLYLKLLSAAQVLGIAGLAGLELASLRTCTRLLFDLADSSGALSALSGLALLLGLGLTRYARAAMPPVQLRADDASECVAAAAELPPIIDLSEPLPPSFIGGHTPLHRVLVALSQWRAEHWPDEVAYRARLERYLQRSLLGSRIERDLPLGASHGDGRIDLVVDDLVSILVKRRFQKTSAALAVTALTRQALARPGKPMLLVVFDAPREAVFEAGSLKTLIDLHQRLPVVTARMPVRRA